MSDVSGTAEIILELVDLVVSSRRGKGSAQDKSRTEALEETLRELIDGARPAPKKIENPGAASKSRAPNTIAPASIKLTASKDAAKESNKAGAHDLSEPELPNLSESDKKKLSQVSIATRPRSAYTPSRAPAFLEDYYDESIVRAEISGDVAPTSVIRAGGEAVDLSHEVRVLLGLEKPEPDAPEPSSHATAHDGASAPVAAVQRGRPTIVHLLAGGVHRGQTGSFEPSSGFILLLGGEGKGDRRVTLDDVLAIFFGLLRGEQPAPAQGQRVVVTLVNDRQVIGLTEDYEEGGNFLTVSPEQRRGNVDRIWIPAWAVKEIQLG